MKSRHHANRLLLVLLTLSLAALLAGCSDDPVTPADTTEEAASVDKDAAQAVAADVATDSGGVTDQLNDIALALGGLGAPAAKTDDHPSFPDSTFVHERFRSAVYDEPTGTWTITLARERGFPEGVPYHAMSRVFTLRLLRADGQPQQFRVVDGDTAVTAEYAIVSGTGIHRLPRREHTLNELNGSFIITGLDQELLVVNGTYHRDASHVLSTPRFVRTLDGVLDIELTDVTVPRLPRVAFCEGVSGTITGTWVADITVTRGDDYVEQHVERQITIELGGCEADIHCGGLRFVAPLGTGDVRP